MSKFAKVSIFSDLNNLTDLTMDPRTATLLGYTQEELEAAFPDYIERLAGTLGKSRSETLDVLRSWYNGYRFELHAPTVFNPDGPLGSQPYRLGYPNREIELSFSRCLAQGFTELPPEQVTGTLRRLTDALREGRIAAMLDTLKIFFAQVPNTIAIEQEKYYQTIFFTVFTLLGVHIEAEVSTNIGRIDAVVKTAANVFVFEFKLNGTADEALAQIREKRYFEPYLVAALVGHRACPIIQRQRRPAP